MAINLSRRFETERVDERGIATEIEKMMLLSSTQRRSFEKRWYDNNFFDDGFHFRYISRDTGKIIDLSERTNLNVPQRAIPKASRQIRGVANLIMGPEYVPVVYPDRVVKANFPDEQEFIIATTVAKDTASKIGAWIQTEWKTNNLKDLMTFMALLSAKHGVSYLQVWPDAVEQKIRYKVFDAFDIYVTGHVNYLEESPYIVKAVPKQVSEIKANKAFDKADLDRLSPDNRYASSEVKQAYMQARFSAGSQSDKAATLIQKEAFIKEYLSDANWEYVKSRGEENGVMEGKSKGDMVMRHTFVGGGVTLLDEYVNLKHYPFVDFRYEPGPIYQVPLIERFIPANKSLDTIMSRIERYANTMIAGTYLKRRGEDLNITNIPGGQVLEYTATPPAQMQMVNLPSFLFNFIGILNDVIEEQGASTSALAQVPSGVRSGVAIESIKASEYANLKIAGDQMKLTVKSVAERMIDIANKYFVTPQTVYYLSKGEPQYFDIIGFDARNRTKVDMPQGAVPVKGDYVVDVEVEQGLGYTVEGKKQTMQQIAQFMVQLAQAGYLSQEAVIKVIERFLEVFQFGSTQEFMQSMSGGMQASPLSQEQMMQMKVALLEAMKDAGVVGKEPAHEDDIQKTKIGVVEALKDIAGE